MKYKPHDYQKFAVDFIETHPEAAVLLECGLGKTSITLTALNDLMFDKFEVRKVLIIAPIRVCKNSWAAEIAKWDHLEGLNYSLVLGSREQRLAALRQKADLYIINRENVQWLIESSGMPFDFDMVVIDELSSFKNHQSKRFKALRKVRPFVKRIVGLTGTPCSNGLMDLWAQFRLLDALEDLIEAQNGKPVLIAYWYKHERDSIMERFECREIKTDTDIADWNASKIPIALIQPSSAGHGLNLQSGGSTIIWYTMPWSLELYQQTNARLWRQGQQSETVVIHHIVSVGTIDEDIMKVLENKDKTQAAMMSAVKARVK